MKQPCLLGTAWTRGAFAIDSRHYGHLGIKNAIRPTALGKKNWLFIGEADAGERSAIIYTVIESCRRRRLDPYAYLKDVLTRLPQMTIQQVSEILPAVWGKPSQQPLRKAS